MIVIVNHVTIIVMVLMMIYSDYLMVGVILVLFVILEVIGYLIIMVVDNYNND